MVGSESDRLRDVLFMTPVCVRAPAKINLHLEVLGLRDDGFHELAMVMQSIDLADELTTEEAGRNGRPGAHPPEAVASAHTI